MRWIHEVATLTRLKRITITGCAIPAAHPWTASTTTTSILAAPDVPAGRMAGRRQIGVATRMYVIGKAGAFSIKGEVAALSWVVSVTPANRAVCADASYAWTASTAAGVVRAVRDTKGACSITISIAICTASVSEGACDTAKRIDVAQFRFAYCCMSERKGIKPKYPEFYKGVGLI